MFAGIMMILVGTFQAIDGLIALFKDELYVVRPNGLVVNVDYTAWGWTHLLLGILLIAGGYAVLSGRVWGRTLGVIAAILSAWSTSLSSPPTRSGPSSSSPWTSS